MGKRFGGLIQLFVLEIVYFDFQDCVWNSTTMPACSANGLWLNGASVFVDCQLMLTPSVFVGNDNATFGQELCDVHALHLKTTRFDQ